MKVVALLGAVAFLGLAQVPASAAPGAPFCARVNGGFPQGAYDDCSYASFEHCRMSIIGIGGFCVQNPYYAWRGEPRVRRTAPRHR